MSNIFKELGYSEAQIQKLEAYIDETLKFIDQSKINGEYQEALKNGDRAGAIHALASYYRARPEYDIPEFCAASYDALRADNGAEGKMREVNIDHDFGSERVTFLFNPTIENPPVNHEWLWQFNRHWWWIHMARAYAKTKDEKYSKAFNAQLLDWVAETAIPEKWNTPGSAYRTIECGIRLMDSWQTAFNLFRHSPLVADEAIAIMLGSMHIQATHLYKHPTRGNWLLMETSGIYNVGSLYSEFTDAEKLRSVATQRVIEEMKKQVLPDGMQYELSPDYHRVSFNCAVNIYKTAMATGKNGEFPKEYLDCIYDMIMAAVKLSAPNLAQPRTNDCYTILTNRFTLPCESFFPDEEVFKFVNTKRAAGTPPKGDTPSVFLPYAGFAAMRSDWSAEATYLCFDVGPLGLAHMHQDKLNINLFKGDEELIFDDGGGQYELSAERTYALSAYDHNTVTVDGMGQNRDEPKKVDSPIDAGFISNDTFDYAYGIYDDEFGEQKEKPAAHTREIRFVKPSFYVVRDTLEATDGKPHTYGLRFHMDTTSTELLEGGAVLARYGKKWDLLIVPIFDDGEKSSDFAAHTAEKEPLLGWYIGRNEEKNHPATTVIMESEPALTHHFTTVLIPVKAGEALPEVISDKNGNITVKLGESTYIVNKYSLNS